MSLLLLFQPQATRGGSTSVTFDAISSGTNITAQLAGGTTTVSHVVGSGTNRTLIVNVSAWNNGGTGTGCSSITYGGVSMTKVTGSGIANGAFYTEQWYLIAPTSGTANIVATVAAKTDKLGLGNVSFAGTNQTNPIDANTAVSGTVGTVTASLTTTSANEYLVDVVNHLSANTPTSHTGTTIILDASLGVDTSSQYGPATTAGANSMNYVYPDPGDAWAYSVLAVKAASSGGVTVKKNQFFVMF